MERWLLDSICRCTQSKMALTVSSKQHRVLQCEVGNWDPSTLELKVRAACNASDDVRAQLNRTTGTSRRIWYHHWHGEHLSPLSTIVRATVSRLKPNEPVPTELVQTNARVWIDGTDSACAVWDRHSSTTV
jgi:hypothetical protein